MMTEKFEELYSELNAMDSQEIKNAIEEAIKKGCKNIIAPFEVRSIIEAQQETISRQKAEIERLNRKLEASTVAKELLRIQSKGNADTAELYQGILKECIKEMVGDTE